MKITHQFKTLLLLTSRAVALASLLSACSGGSDSAEGQNTVPISKPISPISKYIGSYRDEDCHIYSENSDTYFNRKKKFSIIASGKPDTLFIVETNFYYRSNDGQISCEFVVGSISYTAEVTYVGTISSVGFSDPNKQPVNADKIRLTSTAITRDGVFPEVDFFFDPTRQWLLAMDGDKVYFSNSESPKNADGFPTQLDEANFMIRQ